MNLQDFINKLDKIHFTSSDLDTSITGTVSGKEAKVTLTTKLANYSTDLESMPVQVVMRVFIDGNHAQTWGSDSNEMNSKLVTWFVYAKAKAEKIQHEEEKQAREASSNIFKSL